MVRRLSPGDAVRQHRQGPGQEDGPSFHHDDEGRPGETTCEPCDEGREQRDRAGEGDLPGEGRISAISRPTSNASPSAIHATGSIRVASDSQLAQRRRRAWWFLEEPSRVWGEQTQPENSGDAEGSTRRAMVTRSNRFNYPPPRKLFMTPITAGPITAIMRQGRMKSITGNRIFDGPPPSGQVPRHADGA